MCKRLNRKTYPIVCIADEAYAQHAAVMLASLLATNPDKSFDVYLMTYVMQEETKRWLQEVVQGRGRLTIIEDDYRSSGIYALQSDTGFKAWNPIMYLKLLIPKYLPQEIESFLFLDVDIVVNQDVTPLYELAKEGDGKTVVWACEDYKFQDAHKGRLGLGDDDLYINSGVMMVNLKRWREKELSLPTLQFLTDYKERIHNDQDAFALYFKGEIALLPTCQWNATTFFFEQLPRVLDKYLCEVPQVRCNPYIVHYCEPVKPWFRDCHHPYRHLYRQYLQATPWRKKGLPFWGNPYSFSFWKNELKYWLNRWGFRYEEMALVSGSACQPQ